MVATDDAATRTVAQAVALCAEVIAPQLVREGGASDESVRREAREIVAAVMEQPRFWPSMAGDSALLPNTLAAIEAAAARRARGAPFAYAVRSAPFRHLSLYVDERVLIPRPETEYLIDRILAAGGDALEGIAVDVGTGSGAIALALASEGRFSRVIATDLSRDALRVASHNTTRCAEQLRAPVEFREGDALAPLHDLAGEVELIVSNPPYIAFDELSALPAGVRDWEPALALSCAGDGLAVTHAIVWGGGRLLRPGGLLAFEVDARRARRVAASMRESGTYEDVEVLVDLTGRERYVLARRSRTT